MMRFGKTGVPAAILFSLAAAAGAQVLGGTNDDVLLSAQFRIPLTYEAALEKLDAYYDMQVNRKLAAAFPEIGPRQHYDVWHDMWVTFEPAGAQTNVTMKRTANSVSRTLVRNWMLQFAGRLSGEFPLAYKDLPALITAEADIYASQRDVAASLQKEAGMKPLATWQHQGLVVAASPLLSVVLARGGAQGIHHLTVSAENAALARQTAAKITQGIVKPGLCAAYSEVVELDTEIAKAVDSKTSVLGADTAGAIYVPGATRKHQEDLIRTAPEMQKRTAQAAGYYDVKYRVDKPYRQVTVSWTELEQYARDTGKFTGERALGRTQIAAPRMPQGGAPLTTRTRMDALKAGAYRVKLEGELAAGQPVPIDERIYWFDGKSFEEL